MKTIKLTSFALLITFFFSTTSCVVFVKKDNGKHKGWYKNTNNPHNPNSTKQKGKGPKK